ncbi:MAG: BlaI family transcriptional regulator [Gemmatimonadetes bacterium]|jgi:BlaI family penicillinase repressor|nr:BlaI family transcriptional regulator [Gemmatimonadota bacterium]
MDAATLGDRELDVMTTLWHRGSGTVAEVQEALDARLAYTTVLTILRNLEAKGFLRREEEGRAHRYFPRVKQRAAQKRALRRLIDTIFLGSPEALLTQLVADHDLTAEDLTRIAAQLGARPRTEDGR